MFWNWLRPRPSSARRRSFRPRLEQLEEILTPATFNVNTLGDVTNPGDGLLSLREAITAANADTDPDPDTIEFAPSLNGGTITLTQGELAITKTVSITGPGADLLTVSGNNASRVFNVSGGTSEAPVTISGLTVTRGNAVSASLPWGGGVLNSGNLTLDSVAVTDSTAASGGGVTNNQGTLTILRSLVAGNTAASFYGGGVMTSSNSGLRRGSLTVTNSTITGNRAQLGGGGIDGAQTVAVTVTGSTIAGNTTTGSGAGLNVGDLFTVRLTDTLIADNTQGAERTPEDLSVGVVFTSFTADHVLVESGGDRRVQNGVNGNLVGADPKLAALADNGGPTMTMALLAGSPALNAGSADASADQRGLAVGGTRDIGAFEAQAPTLKSPLPSTRYKARMNTPRKVGATAGVLKAFTDTDGDALTAVLVTAPAASKGRLTLRPDGSFTFRPKPNVTGKVTFVVQAKDAMGLLSPTLRFTITIR